MECCSETKLNVGAKILFEKISVVKFPTKFLNIKCFAKILNFSDFVLFRQKKVNNINKATYFFFKYNEKRKSYAKI